CLLLRAPPCAALFPYTTLFRSAPPRFSASVAQRDVPVGLAEELRPALDSHAMLRIERLPRGTDRLHAELHPRFFRRPVGLLLVRSEEHTSELQSRENLVCRLLP